MKKEFKLPELGEEVDEGDVLKVLVKSGDTVEPDQAVLEIETDKATLEVPIDFAGRIEEVRVDEGDHIRVGQVLLVLSTDGDKAETPAETGEQPRAQEAEREEEEEEEEEQPAEEQPELEEPASQTVETRRGAPKTSRTRSKKTVPAAPSIRRLGRELGVDVSNIDGTGLRGRITADDVKNFARTIVSSAGGAQPAKLPDFGKWGSARRERLSGLRRAAARNLARSWSQIPHVTQHDRADITALEASRRQHAESVEAVGGKLTLTAIGIYIAAVALRKFPTFNASLDLANDEMVIKEYVHIGVAVDTERGLLVPVVRNADGMSVSEIAVNVTALAERARNGELSPDEMEGGSFTVTNLGGIGGTSFTPIIDWPQVAILGLSRSRHEPEWNGDGFEPRLVMPLSLSYDHRINDGADAARFLRFVAEAFEDPFMLALGGRA